MLSTNSLSAFSSATTTSAAHGGAPVRLVREQVAPVQPAARAASSPVPSAMPSVAPPRGSLLNLSV